MRKVKGINRYRKFDASSRPRSELELPSYEVEYNKMQYEGTRDDFQEMILTFMLVALFGTGWVVMPILAFGLALLEVRVDALKVTALMRRTDPVPDRDIGAWSGVMATIANLTVFTNIALCAFTTFGKSLPLLDKLFIALVRYMSGSLDACEQAFHSQIGTGLSFLAREFVRFMKPNAWARVSHFVFWSFVTAHSRMVAVRYPASTTILRHARGNPWTGRNEGWFVR